MKLNGLIGPAYELPSRNVEIQKCINLILEGIESGTGKDGQLAYLKGTDGLTKLFALGSGPIRLVYFDGLQKNDGSYFQYNRIFVVSGSEVYRLYRDAISGWQYALMGTMGTSEGPVSAASLEIDYGVTVFVDGSSENYVYRKTDTTTETFQTFTAAGFVPVERATQVLELNGFLIFNQDGTNTFYVTEWNSLTVDPLSFATAEGSPDNIIALAKNNNDLWLINERTIEIWANTGNADFPFERVQGGFIENGCLAPFSVCKMSNVVFWLGRDNSGQGIVYAATGANHQRISTNAIEYEISSYEDPSTARAYAYQKDGHMYYVINFDEATWCYDLSTKTWHQRAYKGTSGLERHRGQTGAFYPNTSQMIVGDYENSNIYFYDSSNYTDDGREIVRERSTPHISNNLKDFFISSLQLDIQSGVGLDGGSSVLGHDPQIMMKWSNDNGYTWSNEHWVSMGKIGEYKTRAIWRRLGISRDKVFSFRITDPVDVVILNCEMEIQGGKN